MKYIAGQTCPSKLLFYYIYNIHVYDVYVMYLTVSHTDEIFPLIIPELQYRSCRVDKVNLQCDRTDSDMMSHIFCAVCSL
jgi:hypothetical protein